MGYKVKPFHMKVRDNETEDFKDVTFLGSNVVAELTAEKTARVTGDSNLNSRIDNIVAQSGDDITEIVDARTGADSTVHASLKARLDSENTDLKNQLDEIAMENSIAIDDSALTTDSYIMTTGSLSPNTSFHVSAMIPVESWMQTVTIKNSGALSGGCAVAFYRTNQFNTVSFISGVSLPNAVTADSPVVTTIPENAVYIAFSARKSETFTASIDGDYHLIFDDTFTSNTKPASANAILDKINEARSDLPQWLWQCDVGKPVMHFSFDDFCRAFIDIIGGSYTSIWSQPLFADLKSIHESTGAVFTLNCFNTFTEDQNYSISDLPSTYASELSAAKTWLKFAFHGADDTSNYNTSTGILAAYNTFVSAIYTFTGDYDCIDRITRLGFFGGTLENVLAIKNAAHGIIGLLSADDTRQSYFLATDVNTYLYNKGKYYDQTNDLLFIKSQPRADSNTATAIANGLLSNPTNMKLTEIYLHEQSWDVNYKNRIIDIATWANDHGYVHAYPSLIYSH